jgi:FolB domain-containing protein
MPDRILIKNLRVQGILGIKPEERVDKQEILINADLFVDIESAAETDDIHDAVNYRTVTKRMIAHVEGSSDLLVEKLAVNLAHIILSEFEVERVILRVEKPGALRFAESVGIEVDRRRSRND